MSQHVISIRDHCNSVALGQKKLLCRLLTLWFRAQDQTSVREAGAPVLLGQPAMSTQYRAGDIYSFRHLTFRDFRDFLVICKMSVNLRRILKGLGGGHQELLGPQKWFAYQNPLTV